MLLRPLAETTMEISDELLCLFTAELREEDGTYRIEIPRREIDVGTIQAGEMYRTALIHRSTTGAVEATPPHKRGPPVTEGEVRDLEIESIGDKGDGIARVERGFVVFVPGTDEGDRVTAKIVDVSENVAFAERITDESA